MTVATNVLIWWLSAADHGSIGHTLPESFPAYMRGEYASMDWRPRRGRLWIASELRDVHVLVERWDSPAWSSPMGLYLGGHCGGIVLLAEDVSFLATMPGIITRTDLSRWDGDTAAKPRADRDDVVGLEAAVEETLRGLTYASEVAPVPPILPGNSDLCSRAANLIRALLSTVLDLKVREEDARLTMRRMAETEAEVERLRGLIATAAKAGASSVRKDHSAALLPLIREVERYLGSGGSPRSAPLAAKDAMDRLPNVAPPSSWSPTSLAK